MAEEGMEAGMVEVGEVAHSSFPTSANCLLLVPWQLLLLRQGRQFSWQFRMGGGGGNEAHETLGVLLPCWKVRDNLGFKFSSSVRFKLYESCDKQQLNVLITSMVMLQTSLNEKKNISHDFSQTFDFIFLVCYKIY